MADPNSRRDNLLGALLASLFAVAGWLSIWIPPESYPQPFATVTRLLFAILTTACAVLFLIAWWRGSPPSQPIR
jgi:drug/metabolite transporter (DMT)-like permease